MAQPPRLLIVDDDTFTRQFMRDLFAHGYDVTCMSSGKDALDVLAKQAFDVVLLDVMMPEVGGLDVLKIMRGQPETADMPVILMSALADGEHVVRGLAMGANDYVTKPVDTAVVRARVEGQVRLKRRLDETKLEINQLQDTQAIKDRFLSIASHDLKGPLANIRLAHFYLRNIVGDQPDALNALETIENTVEAMQEVVEDFLGTAALQQGNPEVNLAEMGLENFLWDVVAHYSMSAQHKEISLCVDQTEGIVCADSGLLLQALGNLVSNAIKYSPPGSTVTLSSQVVAEKVRISVADQGPGIPADERDLLFQPFSKLSTRPTGSESSTGLGLWIARQLVTLHRGSTSVDCPADGGSIFWIELPLHVETTAAQD